jgi:CheY-like chemotaxis protein
MTRQPNDADPRPGRRPATRDATVAEAQYVRIARVLAARSPMDIAARIGTAERDAARAAASTELPQGNPAHRTRARDNLPSALRSVVAWYQQTLGVASAADDGNVQAATGMNSLVREYLSLRSQWEDREARALAARIAEGLPSAGLPGMPDAARPGSQPAPDDATNAALFSGAGQRSEDAGCVARSGGGRRRALLVDDASDVVVTVAAFLEGFGFDVISASSGDMALRIIAQGTPIDLLVTDHAMAGLVGKDLAVQVRQMRPELRTLIITGYPDAGELAQLPPGMALLAKPFRRSELMACVRELLDPAIGASPRNPVVIEP